jgi:hypothetical protein
MAAWRAGLLAILCVGESQDDRVGGRTLKTVGAQLQEPGPPVIPNKKPGLPSRVETILMRNRASAEKL